MNTQSKTSHQCSVLVVEDDPLLRTALSRILRAEGHRVVESSDGPGALTLVRQDCFDVVIVDSMLPGMPGEFIRRAMLSEYGNASPEVVMLASNFSEQYRFEKEEILSLQKPFRVEQLLHIIDTFRPERQVSASYQDIRESGFYRVEEDATFDEEPTLIHAVANF